jgi:hypothetical protein
MADSERGGREGMGKRKSVGGREHTHTNTHTHYHTITLSHTHVSPLPQTPPSSVPDTQTSPLSAQTPPSPVPDTYKSSRTHVVLNPPTFYFTALTLPSHKSHSL